MITMEIILIQHILDQSKFSDDLKPDMLKEIARMDKPNFEGLLNILQLCKKIQGCKVGPKPTVNNVNAGNICG